MSAIVEAICPNLPEHKKVHVTMNNERWMKVINGALNIPPDNVLRSNFIILDKLIEALKAFETFEETPLWDDSLIKGITYYTEEDCLKGIEFLQTKKVLSVDIETRHTGYVNNKILLIGFGYSETEAISFAPPGIDSPKVRQAFEKLLYDPGIKHIYQNGKFDTARLRWLWGIRCRVDEDTMLQHYVGINERKGTHGLKDLGPLYLQAPQWDDELSNWIDKWCSQNKVLKRDFMYDMVPLNILIPYNYRDCCVTFRLNPLFHKLMRADTKWLYGQMVRASNVYREIELKGNLVDQDYLYWLQDDLDTKILESEREVNKCVAIEWEAKQYALDQTQKNKEKAMREGKIKWAITSPPAFFNYKSPNQLKWLLEKVTGQTLTSTNKEVLKELFAKYPDIPFIHAMQELRRWSKYMDTYVMGIQNVLCEDGRIRCTFNLHGTETGRLSSSKPNMQNIPRSPYIKNLVVAAPGYKLVQLDYSQAELRVLAWLSDDDYLKGVYRRGEDLHDSMALSMFGEGFTKEDRVGAKTVNFGIPYGRGPGTIARQIKISVDKAAGMIRNWFKAAPKAKVFLDARRQEPFSREGTTYKTLFGRTRHYIITADNRNHVGNEAVNFPISSLASDLTMLSVLDIHEQMDAEGLDAHIINTVHDSIIIEVVDDPAVLQRVVEIGTKVMTEMAPRHLPNLDFPFVADAEIGHSWGDLEDADTVFGEEEDEEDDD